jgi:diguanylate cyclase (GGDEF)-like protein
MSPGGDFAVLFIDLDSFKDINDTLGHGIGDQLLMRVASILQASVREVDAVARLGGDEFTILLEQIHSLKDAIEVAERIQESLQPGFTVDGHEIFTSASIGIVMGNQQYQQMADIAMYRAKALGKACYEVFDQAMYSETLHQVELETHLRYAISKQELELHYQPIITLQPVPKLEGFEVLLRWNHSTKGMIPTAEFIAIAEETGLINAIGEWVLQEACTQFSDWCQLWPNCSNLYLSINISGRQLRETALLRTLDRMLEETHIPAHGLHFEITESSLVQNAKVAAKLLKQVKKRGVHISLDDFGTGFSSLSYLHQFPIDTLKIDRSFVDRLGRGEKGNNIVQSIITLAHSMRLVTVAEGIETRQQLEYLNRLGCEAGQGYF